MRLIDADAIVFTHAIARSIDDGHNWNRSAEERKDNRMKTLDEVIEALEICSQIDAECEKCPYKSTAKGWCEEKDRDALHYLKAYKDDKDDLTAHRAYWKEQHENNALTWDELQKMKGKAVWIETDNAKFWTVVDNFRTICNQECLCCSKGYMSQSTHARGDWQAYRKERNEFTFGIFGKASVNSSRTELDD